MTVSPATLGHQNYAGELGYIIIDEKRVERFVQEDETTFGCMEILACAQGSSRLAAELGFRGQGMAPIAEEVFKATDRGDSTAKQIVHQITTYLATGLVNVSVVLGPEAIIIGGVSEANRMLLEFLSQKVKA